MTPIPSLNDSAAGTEPPRCESGGYRRSPTSLLLALLLSIGISTACTAKRVDLPAPSRKTAKVEKKSVDYSSIRNHSYRNRGPIPIEQNLYEGSLWKDESSWGNLLRDHRARFKDDVITIVDLPAIITIPKDQKEAVSTEQPLVAQGEEAAGTAIRVIDALTGEALARQEQKEVLQSLKSVSARVTKVLPNGNMVIVGEKIDYKQLNSIRYVTRVKGVIRPEDVNQENEVGATKLARSEVQTKRQVLVKNINSMAPVLGAKKTGLLDRLSHLATPSTTKSSVKSVQTK